MLAATAYYAVGFFFGADPVELPRQDLFSRIHKPKSWDDVRSLSFAVAGIVGALFGLFQLHNSAARTQLNRIDTETKREQERNERSRLHHERQRDNRERYLRASQLLRDKDLSGSLAGVDVLKHLALEPSANYHDTVLTLLAGFVREQTTRDSEWGDAQYLSYPVGEKPVFESNDGDLQAALKRYQKAFKAWLALQKPPQQPVQQAVNVIGRILEQRIDDVNPIILSDAVLIKVNFMGLYFSKCTLCGARLEGASLMEAHLEEANLEYVHLEGADLENAHLNGAWLEGAHFDGAYIGGANFEGADLEGADLSNVIGLTDEQLDAAVWPTGNPPKLPDGDKPERFDKSAYTDPNNPMRLLPKKQWPHRQTTYAEGSDYNPSLASAYKPRP